MSARSWALASRRSPAARCPISTSWARRSSSSSATSSRPNTARASRRRTARRHGGQGRDLLRPLPAEEAGGGVTTCRRPERRRRSVDRCHSRMVQLSNRPRISRLRGFANDLAAPSRSAPTLTPPSSGLPWSAPPAPSGARRRGPCRPEVRHRGEIELHPVGPGQHREQIAVGDGELLAHQIVAAGKLRCRHT